jgi:hypothetical protein
MAGTAHHGHFSIHRSQAGMVDVPIMISLAFAAFTAIWPATPLQTGEHLACAVYDRTHNKVLMTRPFVTTAATRNSKYDAFIAALRAQGYLPVESEIEGGCSAASSAERATAAVTAFRNRYAAANQLTVPFE